MVILDRKLRRLVPYWLVFFPTPAMAREAAECLALIRMARLIAANEPGKGRHVVQQHITATSCVDLSQDLGALFHAMHATFRNKVKKAERLGERVTIERNGARAKTEFLELYANLASAKAGVVTPLDGRALDRYLPSSDVFLIYLDGETLCGHVNLRDASIGRTRLLYSATRRFVHPESARFGGILNCYLHWREMQTYKQEGFETYDLGGISSNEDPEVEGIDRFKLAFGGAIVKEYDYVCAGIPMLGRVATWVFGTGQNR